MSSYSDTQFSIAGLSLSEALGENLTNYKASEEVVDFTAIPLDLDEEVEDEQEERVHS